MDASFAFARFAATTRYEDLPAEVVEMTKKQILDITGVTMGGSSKPGIRELAELMSDWGGKQESTLFCFGGKVPVPVAAQVNASMGHALDYDDTGAGPTHPSVVIVPTCLVMGERQGNFSGKDLIAAVAVGTEIMCRMGQAFRLGHLDMPSGGHPGAGWHLTTLYGYIAAAAVAGRILGLTEEQLRNAMGIAYHQCSGNGQCVTEGALTKRMGPGFSAKGGITAAFMAQKGITGAVQCLEGEVGLYPLYHQGKYNSAALTEDLGRTFLSLGITVKPYPCCKGTHAFANAATELATVHKVDTSRIKEITLYCGNANSVLIAPLKKRTRPETAVDTQFSIPWAVTAILTRKRASVGDFSDAAIADPQLLDLAAKIKVVELPEMAGTEDVPPARIAVTMDDGRTITVENRLESGPVQKALPFSVYETKFRDCISYALKPFSDQEIDTLVDRIINIDQMDNIQALIKLLY